MRSTPHANGLLICTVFGTRPEAIKLLPVAAALQSSPNLSSSLVVTAQHTDLLDPLLGHFAVTPDRKLDVQRPGQSLDQLLGRLMPALGEVLAEINPGVVLVQGDTTSALAGALAAHHARIPVAHVEAGLRSGARDDPFPEEMNRRLISRLATLHFAATEGNRAALLAEGVADADIVVTGNPVVDALQTLGGGAPGPQAQALIDWAAGRRLIVVTTHRRENFGGAMAGQLAALARFVAQQPNTCLVFLVHPNPQVRLEAARSLPESDSIRHAAPLVYPDFLALLRAAWLIASDSGGVQEEAPSLGKPLIVLRETTERPEAIASGCAKLAGRDAGRLAALLEEVAAPGSWAERVCAIANPFGDGHAADRIATALATRFVPARLEATA